VTRRKVVLCVASGAIVDAVFGDPIRAAVVVGSATGPNTYSNLQHAQLHSVV
jgi:hypothetical protein